LLSAGVNDLNANAIGFSTPLIICDKIPAMPVGLASHAITKGSSGLYGVKIRSFEISFLSFRNTFSQALDYLNFESFKSNFLNGYIMVDAFGINLE